MQNKTYANPMGLDGFEFIEFSSPTPETMAEQFRTLGFMPVAKHKSKEVILFRQGGIHFILNKQVHCQAHEHALTHGPAACAIGFRVDDANKAYQRAIECGAIGFQSQPNQGELTIPAIRGIGGSVIYLIDRYEEETLYDIDFVPLPGQAAEVKGAGLLVIDHLTHNVKNGRMDYWADFYHRIFNFQQIRYFDIEGEKTGLLSRAMASPCGKIKIPLNESKDEQSQIAEFLRDFNGEGIQHIALTTDDIHASVENLRKRGVAFLDTPDSYYDMIAQRLPWQQEDIDKMRANKVLIDGESSREHGLLLQIFTENMFGPQFIEIIQRKGNEGFGEGNFTALFKAIERDQQRRGVL